MLIVYLQSSLVFGALTRSFIWTEGFEVPCNVAAVRRSSLSTCSGSIMLTILSLDALDTMCYGGCTGVFVKLATSMSNSTFRRLPYCLWLESGVPVERRYPSVYSRLIQFLSIKLWVFRCLLALARFVWLCAVQLSFYWRSVLLVLLQSVFRTNVYVCSGYLRGWYWNGTSVTWLHFLWQS